MELITPQELKTISKEENLALEEAYEEHKVKNLYPAVRHILLIILVLFTLIFLVFLMHQNGRSIYEHGI